MRQIHPDSKITVWKNINTSSGEAWKHVETNFVQVTVDGHVINPKRFGHNS